MCVCVLYSNINVLTRKFPRLAHSMAYGMYIAPANVCLTAEGVTLGSVGREAYG